MPCDIYPGVNHIKDLGIKIYINILPLKAKFYNNLYNLARFFKRTKINLFKDQVREIIARDKTSINNTGRLFALNYFDC